ncbi:MAG: 4Fe-4S dicluster domain-containing protein [Deltaproteobacteria bacterium]|nr:4Fe-4S dicluster domain-containing protein [Deltaproteobacteria bacterium]
MARYGMIVDLNKCTGCMTCVLACKQENLTGPGVFWNKILEIENETFDYIAYVWHACMHCDDPPCVAACSSKAISKRPDGIVLIDQQKCNGQRKCIDACPYGVISINTDEGYFPGKKLPFETSPERYRVQLPGKASKCTLCAHRIDKGQVPVCVQACQSEALIFGDLDDPNSAISKKLWQSKQLLAAKGARPKVSYITPRNLSKQVDQRVTENSNMVLQQ